jgi:putative hydrolase of the HAD superfamily
MEVRARANELISFLTCKKVSWLPSNDAEAMTSGLVIFDFDGTLAHRPGLWGQCLADVLQSVWPTGAVSADQLRPHLHDGFPWHRPESVHPELSDPDAWWDGLRPVLERAFSAVNLPPDLSDDAVRETRRHYCDPNRFEVFPDTSVALSALRGAGWHTAILSNHVPELPEIVEGLGLAPLFDDVHSSAWIGYEKPHPEAFRLALNGTSPDEAWMVGDNEHADIVGAERVGLRAILVRAPNLGPAPAQRPSVTLLEAVRTILATE